MSRRPPTAVLGAGRAGGGLAVLLAAQGWPVRAIWSRRRHRARTVARRIASQAGFRVACPVHPGTAAADAGLVLLAVPDDALEAMVNRLLRRGQPAAGTVVLHLSGVQPVQRLAPLAARGAHIGALHPLVVFPAALPPPCLLAGAGFAVDGAPVARTCARRLARALGGEPYHVRPAGRTSYHLAASLVGNDSVALFHLAVQQAVAAGLKPAAARRALARLLESAAAELRRYPAARALTGPLVRGDAGTLRRHLAVGGPAAEVHRLLSRILLTLARDAGRVRPAAVRRLTRVLGAGRSRRR